MKKRKWLFSILFLSPAMILYTVFIILPVCISTYYSLTSWKGYGPQTLIWFDNYIRLFNSSDYWLVVKNTLTLVLFTVIVQVPMGLILAYILHWFTKGASIYRAIFFVPVVVAPVAIGIMFSLFLNSDLGPVNNFLDLVHLSSLKQNWLSDYKVVLFSVMTPQVWQYIGLFVVILLAGLRTIPTELFEVAIMDGASKFTILINIVIPLLWEIIVICILLAVTGSLKSFDHSWAITNGGPGYASAYIATLMYKKAFLDGQFGYASAITMTIMVYAISFTVIFRKLVLRNSIEY